MKLLILTYHRITDPDDPFSANTFRDYLQQLVATYPFWPPDSPSPPSEKSDKLAVFLTFDDATFDFYHFVYPLLQKLDIQVLLAVPTQHILESCDLPAHVRLAPVQAPYHHGPGHALCTWSEISEMVNSGHVRIAAHSHTHPMLTHKQTCLKTELLGSREHIENAINQAVDTFVFPYGRKNAHILRETLRHYRYAMRMGMALHPQGWPSDGLLYRVNGDYGLAPHFSRKTLAYYSFNYWFNRGRWR